MKIRDQKLKKLVNVLDADCPRRACYWPRLDPGSFCQGRGYRHRSNDWLCGTREIHGCPVPKPDPNPKKRPMETHLETPAEPNQRPAQIVRVSVTRLFNLGDFEHAKYEVTADVRDGKGGTVLCRLTALIEQLGDRPPRQDYEVAKAREWLGLTDEQKRRKAGDWLDTGDTEPEMNEETGEWIKNRDVKMAAILKVMEAFDHRRDAIFRQLDELGAEVSS
jgi:hypothetical protein